MQRGSASICFEHPVSIIGSSCVTGPKENQGPLENQFDLVDSDGTFGKDSWEEAESEMQKRAVEIALQKQNLSPGQIRYLFGGDLLGESIATSFGMESFSIPMFGLFGACSTMGESLSLASMAVNAGYGDYMLCISSSHYASAEKQFRYPSDYGNQRPLSACWTVTGAGCVILGKEGGMVEITGITTGRIVDYGVKDSMNMGACMAPAAADTIYRNFQDFAVRPEEYDKIITGDLGVVGSTALLDLLREKGYEIGSQHMDCGLELFDRKRQDVHAGGSGCGCSAVYLSAHILKMIARGTWKKVLFVPTGALLSKISFNEGQTIPGIAHGVILEKKGEPGA